MNISTVYGSKGRKGRAMSGGSNKTAIGRQLANRTLRAWTKLYIQVYKRQPSEGEQRAALENPVGMGNDIRRWTSHKMTFRHGQSCICRMCKDAAASDGRRWSQHLKSWIDNDKRIKAEAAKLPDDNPRFTRDQERLLFECRIPKTTLVRYVTGQVSYGEIAAIFNVSEERLRDYAEVYGLL